MIYYMLGACVLLLLADVLYESLTVRVTREEIYLERFPAAFDGLRVVLATDLHVDSERAAERVAARIGALAAEGVDLVLIGGDLINTNGEATRAIAERLGRLPARLGVYAVRGNHDIETKALRPILESAGVGFLDDEAIVFDRAGGRLSLVGLSYGGDGYKLAAISGQMSSREGCIVLAHTPEALLDVLDAPSRDGEAWADVMLNGHTHGGQVTLFGLYAPIRAWQDGTLWKGQARTQGITQFVSNGMGTAWLPIRFCAPAQLHLLTLRAGKNPSGADN